MVDTVVVGHQLERAYGGPRPGVLATTISLTTTADVVAAKPAGRERRLRDLLTVGRIEPEKNPLLAVDLLVSSTSVVPAFGFAGLEWVASRAS